jgi:hypothetical protein
VGKFLFKLIKFLKFDANTLVKFSTEFSTGKRESFPQITKNHLLKYGQNLKYFLLDRRKNGCKIHS